MNGKLMLYSSGDADISLIKEQLEELGYEIIMIACPRTCQEWFKDPFMRDEEGVPYYGTTGINFFINRARQNGCAH